VPRLVLASTSPYRRALLRRLGVPFLAASHTADEEAAKAGNAAEADPERLARHLAQAKARSIARAFPDALIVGSDQVAAVPRADAPGYDVLSKPGTEPRAVQQLLALRGRELRLITAVCLHDTRDARPDEVFVDEHRVGFRTFSEAEAIDYVRRDRPLDCAGAFRLEALGPALLRYCRGDDATAVVGLPLIALAERLTAHGLPVLGPLPSGVAPEASLDL
jgi:septum formation protein